MNDIAFVLVLGGRWVLEIGYSNGQDLTLLTLCRKLRDKVAAPSILQE